MTAPDTSSPARSPRRHRFRTLAVLGGLALALAGAISLRQHAAGVGMAERDEDPSRRSARLQRTAHDGAASPNELEQSFANRASSAGRDRALAALERALPEWGQDVNRVPDEVREHFDPTSLDPLELARLVTKEELKFAEVRQNGRTVYKNRAEDSVVKFDQKRGYWKYISPLRSAGEGATLSDAESERLAHELAEQFGLPDAELGATRAAGIASAGVEGEPEVIGRHARIPRQINGAPVDESGLMVTFNPDGTVARAERRWPQFELDGGPVKTRDQAKSDLAAAFEQEFASAEREAGASVHYVYDEETGMHDPVLRVDVSAPGADEVDRTVEYSLTSGELISGAETPDDDN